MADDKKPDKLQWGRRSSSTDSSFVDGAPVLGIVASMGPSIVVDG